MGADDRFPSHRPCRLDGALNVDLAANRSGWRDQGDA